MAQWLCNIAVFEWVRDNGFMTWRLSYGEGDNGWVIWHGSEVNGWKGRNYWPDFGGGGEVVYGFALWGPEML